ncbi:hypothetical protein KVR01_009301 [Diaporthe batatas]|uniref:uncharacterized protein n=1 Tax=Diaporthe batatas TaxID=748121 RepID=UPI001D046D72|nr:uncharacterized protein KVR01_009301 [Diaporthe batatas]KAG8161037.1 hypothetical protein KVR01_009301 [Diaporthe batatas]
MQFFTAIVAGLFATAASAIDLHLEYAGGCSTSGGGFICYNINPDTCCSVNSGTYFGSGSFRAIPRNWNINARGHGGPNCGAIREQRASGGSDYVCLGGGPFGGTGYGFANKKMIRGATEAREESVGCATPDVAYLADGTLYNYTAVVETGQPADELVQLFQSGDIPESFDAFKLEETLKL